MLLQQYVSKLIVLYCIVIAMTRLIVALSRVDFGQGSIEKTFYLREILKLNMQNYTKQILQ